MKEEIIKKLNNIYDAKDLMEINDLMGKHGLLVLLILVYNIIEISMAMDII
jgi:hypothetical protein